VAGAVALGRAEGVLATVGHVEEAILVLVLFVDRRHQRGCHKRVLKNENITMKEHQR